MVETSDIIRRRAEVMIGLSVGAIFSFIGILSRVENYSPFVEVLIIGIVWFLIVVYYAFKSYESAQLILPGNRPSSIATEETLNSDNLEKEIYRRRIRGVERSILFIQTHNASLTDNYLKASLSLKRMMITYGIWIIVRLICSIFSSWFQVCHL